jgi:hypothetical protein
LAWQLGHANAIMSLLCFGLPSARYSTMQVRLNKGHGWGGRRDSLIPFTHVFFETMAGLAA